jgi:hypothetical protein
MVLTAEAQAEQDLLLILHGVQLQAQVKIQAAHIILRAVEQVDVSLEYLQATQ